MNPEERVAAYLETGAWPADDPEGPPEELEQLRALLGDELAWQEPPPGLAEAIVADIEGERRRVAHEHAPLPFGQDAPTPASHPDAPVSQPTSLHPRAQAHSRGRGARSGAVTRLVGGVAAAVVLLAVLVVAIPRGPAGEQIALAGTELAPQASATVDAEITGAGVRILLDVSGLPPAPEGYYYQGWVRGSRGSVPIGTFHWRQAGGPIELWSGVLLEDYPDLTVTLEPETEDPTSSGQVYLQGTYTASRQP